MFMKRKSLFWPTSLEVPGRDQLALLLQSCGVAEHDGGHTACRQMLKSWEEAGQRHRGAESLPVTWKGPPLKAKTSDSTAPGPSLPHSDSGK